MIAFVPFSLDVQVVTILAIVVAAVNIVDTSNVNAVIAAVAPDDVALRTTRTSLNFWVSQAF